MKLSITLPDELGDEIREAARERGVSVSEFVAELIQDGQRRHHLDAWTDEVLAKNPPTEAEVAEIQAIIDAARATIPVRKAG